MLRKTHIVIGIVILYHIVLLGMYTPIPCLSQKLVVSHASEPATDPDIQWFKKELKIDQKYMEHREGILGLSWAHFLTMVFLFASFAIGLVAFIIRQRRTKELLKTLLEEEKKE